MAKTKEIKRYANRRLYDAETSKTITLEDVADCIKNGYDVKVIDNLTGEDITSKVLGQTFLKVSLDTTNVEFNNFLLTTLIREVSTNISELFTRLVQGGVGAASLSMEKMEKIVQMMVEQGDLQLADKTDYLDEAVDHLKSHTSRIEAQVKEGLGVLRNELTDDSGQKIEELSSKLDEMARIIQDMQTRE